MTIGEKIQEVVKEIKVIENKEYNLITISKEIWDSDYQGEPTIPLSVIEKITTEIQKKIDENLDGEGIPNEYAYCYESVLGIIDKAVKECTHDKG